MGGWGYLQAAIPVAMLGEDVGEDVPDFNINPYYTEPRNKRATRQGHR